MNEETVNKFTVGATVLGVNMYLGTGEYESLHVLLDNGAMLTVSGDVLAVDVLGPSDPTEEPTSDDLKCQHLPPPRLSYIADHFDARRRQKLGERQLWCSVCWRWVWRVYWEETK